MTAPTDKLVWDTGHQAYAHKLLTGRLDGFGTLRQLGGIGGFPRRSESEHDVFDGGHAGTGLSIAEGLALAREVRGTDERIVVVVGDAALITGMSLEALNDIGHRRTQLLIVLNDNEMSISPTVGALEPVPEPDQALAHLARQQARCTTTWSRSYPSWARPRSSGRGGCASRSSTSPSPGSCSRTWASPTSAPCRATACAPGDSVFRRALRDIDGPVLVHVRTQKGRGYQPAVADQIGFHGAALPPMTVVPGGASGALRDGPSAPETVTRHHPMAQAVAARSKPPNYTSVMAAGAHRARRHRTRASWPSRQACPRAPAWRKFQAAFPDRMYDVGIAEQHAVTLATGLALGRDCGRWWRSTRHSCSAPSTRPCTTSARTTRRW